MLVLKLLLINIGFLICLCAIVIKLFAWVAITNTFNSKISHLLVSLICMLGFAGGVYFINLGIII